MAQLAIGTPFPSLTAQRVGGGSLTIPAQLPEGYSVILFYRAHW